MNQLLSVNCVFVAALHRLYGPDFFAHILKQLMSEFLKNHNSEDAASDACTTRVKNILNCLLHWFLFESIDCSLLFGVIKMLLQSFREHDIEVLIFLLHNIGLQLRKKEPEALKNIIDLFTQKKNSYLAESKLTQHTEDEQAERKAKERKLNFLGLELADIKNNKGNVTL